MSFATTLYQSTHGEKPFLLKDDVIILLETLVAKLAQQSIAEKTFNQSYYEENRGDNKKTLSVHLGV
jgi:hypothetical protein